ncbi:transcription elongation factor GreA [uncultured Enorma sp.]|jgi:transcription elongation factor GreA|uniref:transcription elongation factor GreA n=1 Tax=uncultured Enorma sp. TaxID=1714346 RepID=UPI0025F6D903|nr:transcription elongation factor GreA [uncultured Enorma sp.]
METNEIVLTAEGRQKLEEELAYREGDLTKEIVERIKVARDFGDLSENSEYDDAREEQAKNAARINEIRAILANAKDAEDTGHTFTVSLGCVVELVDENGEVTEVTIVGSTETDSLRHRISNESPIGRAIINHAEGETVEVQLPSGKTRTYTITKISR